MFFDVFMNIFHHYFKISVLLFLTDFSGHTLLSSLFPRSFVFALANVFASFYCVLSPFLLKLLSKAVKQVPMTIWSYSKWYCFGKYFKMILIKTSTLVGWMASVKYLQSLLNFLSLKIETIALCASDPSSSHSLHLDSSMV